MADYGRQDDGEDDSYADYSCSTPIERLARDVETHLRSWYVVDGSDRHVSVGRSGGSNISDEKSSSSSAPGEGVGGGSGAGGPRALRTQRFEWELTYQVDGGYRLSHVVQLQLTLWDAPPTAMTAATGTPDRRQQQRSGPRADSDDGALPYSLLWGDRLQQNSGEDRCSSFQNFSYLFGIGQHVTLALAPLTGDDDGISESDALLPEDLVAEIVANASSGIFNRHQHVDKKKLSYRSKDDDFSVQTATPAWFVLTNVLSGWLQTAMNLAAANCHCIFPMFGIWGRYCHEDWQRQPSWPAPSSESIRTNTRRRQQITALSSCPWLPTPQDLVRRHSGSGGFLPLHAPSTSSSASVMSSSSGRGRRSRGRDRGKRNFLQDQLQPKNSQYAPPSVQGVLLSPECRASFTCTVVPMTPSSQSSDDEDGEGRRPLHLSSWGDLLFQLAGVDRAALLKARHVYCWTKPVPEPKRIFGLNTSMETADGEATEWRMDACYRDTASPTMTAGSEEQEAASVLMNNYRRQCHTYALLLLEKALGATERDPIWGPPDDPVASLESTATWSGLPSIDDDNSADPLLTLPLKTRSQRTSRNDWIEMQVSVERMILDPRHPTSFWLQTFYDSDVAHASLAASQRCVLAALIRTSTLPFETLCNHLIDPSLIERWDSTVGNQVAADLARSSGVGSSTMALVAAMDWEHASVDMIDAQQAEHIVDQILDGSLMHGFPDLPSLVDLSKFADRRPLRKAAPPARLLSLLCLHMARVRLPSSMMMVWHTFVQELRSRWDCREILPNMRLVQGIDSPCTQLSSSGAAIRTKNADFAGHLNCSEPDPDESNCLIGQKLQLFNVCLECILARERREIEILEKKVEQMGTKRPRLGDAEPGSESQEGGVDPLGESSKLLDESSAGDDEFFDAEEIGNDRQSESASNVARRDPSGRRCPVVGSSLLSTGEQMFAPYLQRPYPLTDDVVAERRHMLAQQKQLTTTSTISNARRMEVSKRFQEPKLFSDMQSFKAANPNAVFEDFISWYGNPVNPLDDYEELDDASAEIKLEGLSTAENADATLEEANNSMQGLNASSMGVANGLYPEAVAEADTRAKMDKATEAIKTLKETRDFWTETWKKAEPLPASEQHPLFDPSTTVELALDYFETLHPATLMCQVLAVNLASAYFVLLGAAGDASAKLPIVRQSLDNLRAKVEVALEHLSTDALNAVTFKSADINPENPSTIATIKSIALCERACVACGNTEVIVARAVSLLHKLHGDFELVEFILRSSEGAPVDIVPEGARSALLHMVSIQQQSRTGESTDVAEPSVREYLLRGVDCPTPSQLCVRYDDVREESNRGIGAPGMMAIAVTKCTVE